MHFHTPVNPSYSRPRRGLQSSRYSRDFISRSAPVLGFHKGHCVSTLPAHFQEVSRVDYCCLVLSLNSSSSISNGGMTLTDCLLRSGPWFCCLHTLVSFPLLPCTVVLGYLPFSDHTLTPCSCRHSSTSCSSLTMLVHLRTVALRVSRPFGT